MIEFRVDRAWSFDGTRLWIMKYDNGKAYIAKPIKLDFVEADEGALLPEPSLEVNSYHASELITAAKKALAGYTLYDDKESYETAKRVEKAMQEHINSLKLVVDRVVK